MKKFLKPIAKYAIILYVAQALVGISVGVYTGIQMSHQIQERKNSDS